MTQQLWFCQVLWFLKFLSNLCHPHKSSHPTKYEKQPLLGVSVGEIQAYVMIQNAMQTNGWKCITELYISHFLCHYIVSSNQLFYVASETRKLLQKDSVNKLSFRLEFHSYLKSLFYMPTNKPRSSVNEWLY